MKSNMKYNISLFLLLVAAGSMTFAVTASAQATATITNTNTNNCQYSDQYSTGNTGICTTYTYTVSNAGSCVLYGATTMTLFCIAPDGFSSQPQAVNNMCLTSSGWMSYPSYTCNTVSGTYSGPSGILYGTILEFSGDLNFSGILGNSGISDITPNPNTNTTLYNRGYMQLRWRSGDTCSWLSAGSGGILGFMTALNPPLNVFLTERPPHNSTCGVFAEDNDSTSVNGISTYVGGSPTYISATFTERPGKPTNFVASPSCVAGAPKIDLSWTSPYTGAFEHSYIVSRFNMTSGGATTTIFSSSNQLNTPTTFTDTTVVSGQTYVYSVKARIWGYGQSDPAFTTPPNTNMPSCNLPDLTAGDPTTNGPTPSSAMTGQSTTLYSIITNNGPLGTPSYFYNLFQRATSAAGAGATDIPSALTTPALGSTPSSRQVSQNYTFTSPGTTYIRACADMAGAGGYYALVSEYAEGNNCSNWMPITVLDGTLPNLTATVSSPAANSTVYTPNYLTSSASVSFTGNVSNNNNNVTSAADSSTVTLELDTPGNVIGTPINNRQNWMNNGGRNHNFSWTVSVPVGSHQFRVCADANNVINEASDSDNCSSPWVPFTVAYSAETNLRVNSSLTPAQINPGDIVTITWCDRGSGAQNCAYASACQVNVPGNNGTDISGTATEQLYIPKTYTLNCQPNGTQVSVYVPVLQPYGVTLNKTGQGTVTSNNNHPTAPTQPDFDCGPACITPPPQTRTFYQDTVITFNFTASPGRIILNITGCDGAPTIVLPGRKTGSCNITVNNDRTISVTFALDPSFKEF